MTKSQVDLEYCSFYLQAGWVVQAPLDIEFLSINLIRAQASCEISFLSAGSDKPDEVVGDLFTRLLRRAQSTGRMVMNLEEFFDLEFISELDSDSGSLGFQHTFIMLCGNIIILANLKGHDDGDADEIRLMLSSFRPTRAETSEGTLARLPKGNLFNDWDRFGNMAVTTGIKL